MMTMTIITNRFSRTRQIPRTQARSNIPTSEIQTVDSLDYQKQGWSRRAAM